ncbi:MAG: asparagine synthase (glutamine-hydrolyzing) [Candidatus Marinimicrobia bacterium]|jgi:asparagine synthase (glutamine-hydrolysing)|nr:asparagine synthase (glutamine-hydrolyzing) [Candidatus Neomarinimicrobiota bacterium]
MCGISGFFNSRSSLSKSEMESRISSMSMTLSHRGPDDYGIWVDQTVGVALGHQRLSIVDLSAAGHQPMSSRDGRYVIVYNGEIYNAQELKNDLVSDGYGSFKGHSDTEILVECCAVWGVRKTVKRLIGMFSFALWDQSEQQLTLVRDRMGIKPLYWGRFGSLILFGSELKALRKHPGWNPQVNPEALSNYCRYGYVPAPLSIYQGVYKLKPGTILECSRDNTLREEAYWSLHETVQKGCSDPLQLSDEAATDELERLLSDAVNRRMVADVPLGSFLSGGIDSAMVTALMQANSARPVRTFSIGFRELGYDEAPYAAAIASHLGTDHTELYMAPGEAQEIIPSLQDIYDEPFADASQIPTYLLSKLTRDHVTVSLSGDGGDELFAGYSRHFQSLRVARIQQYMPHWVLSNTAQLIKKISPDTLDQIARVAPGRLRVSRFGEKLHKAARILAANPEDFHNILISHWEVDELLSERINSVPSSTVSGSLQSLNLVEQMLLQDSNTYLPDDILTKVDRASMAASLEARVPILDHRVVEFAWHLPLEMKLREGQGKWILRNLLDRYVPRSLIDRPKAGFSVPIGAWLRGPLKDWGEHLLNPERLSADGLFNPDKVWKTWQAHQSGNENHAYRLWIILMFQAWHEHWF